MFWPTVVADLFSPPHGRLFVSGGDDVVVMQQGYATHPVVYNLMDGPQNGVF